MIGQVHLLVTYIMASNTCFKPLSIITAYYLMSHGIIRSCQCSIKQYAAASYFLFLVSKTVNTNTYHVFSLSNFIMFMKYQIGYVDFLIEDLSQ